MNLTQTQKVIIRILFVEKEGSRSLLAERLNLTNAALTLAIKPLLASSMILESRSTDAQRVGRKELKLTLNPEYGCFLGVDIRKRRLYYSIMDFAGNLIVSSDSSSSILQEFYAPYANRLLAVGVTVRGKADQNALKNTYPQLFRDLDALPIPHYFLNNVDALANIYALHHPKEKNFILIKYGPGVGSSIYVNGNPLGYSSELGHTYYLNKTVESTISYVSLFGKNMEENEGTPLILGNEKLLRETLHVLAFALINADSLLSLQTIILSGALLSQEDIVDRLGQEIQKIEPTFDTKKLIVYQNYADINIKKSGMGAFIELFSR